VLVVSLLSNSRGEPILCYVTDRRILPVENPVDACEALLRKVEEVAAAGIDWIQIREKDLSGKDCAALTNEALRRAAKAAAGGANAARILVNDHLDVALSEGAGGVHLGEHGLPVADAKRLTGSRGRGKDFLIGVSCHSLKAAQAAERGGADYIFFGPVFATPSKAAHGAPQGLDRLAEVCRSVSVPVLAIGGVTLENAASCLAAGAMGIAAIRLFQDTQDIKSLVQALRKPKR
jgi:thiamine-phosphate pyrophosphorylase